VQKNKHNFLFDVLNLMFKVPTCCVPVIYVCFPLASCVSHVPSPYDLATYRKTCEAWSKKLTSEELHPQAHVGAELAVCGACNDILLRLEVTHHVGCVCRIVAANAGSAWRTPTVSREDTNVNKKEVN
jgi:hypothetical protein